ncbi:aldolase [Wilcoxina mikolae CBS 423.85]|nr:aldolase [Wilcoxina mikolae CBS 423.85]
MSTIVSHAISILLASVTNIMTRPSLLRTTRRTFTTSSHPPRFSGVRVRIVEVGARDGLQNEKTPVSLDTKLELLSRLSKTGLRHIEAGSFVSPKWVPQMANTSAILSHLESTRPKDDGVTYSYLVPNTKGLSIFLSTTPPASTRGSEIAIFASASEGFSQKNLNCSITESLSRFEPVVASALEHGFQIRGYVSMIISCPYSGATPVSAVADVVEKLLDMGCYEVSLGDTNGVGTPGTVGRLLRYLVTERGIRVEQLAAHFHDTYGQAIVNSLVALEHGIRTFDSSVGGLGGCPYAQGATGNVATEDLVYFLEGTGVDTGVDLEAVVKVGEWISKVLGRGNGSRVGKALAGTKGAM